MIRFFYRAGSEATATALTESIGHDLAAGDKVLLLVPEQETVAVERRMLAALPPRAQLSFEVVNFSRLANRTFREFGGHRWHTATPAVRALLMWHALRELSPMLLRYGQHATEPRLCDMMLDTVSRCRAYCITADDMIRTADALGTDEPLRDKLLDIGTVLGVFEQSLAAQFDNGDDELDRLAAILAAEGGALLTNTHVYVDSFTDFTGQERAVLTALMRHAASVSFTFPLAGPSDEGLHLESAVRTHRDLTRLAHELSLDVELCRGAAHRPQSAREYLVEHLFAMDAEPCPLALMEEPDVKLLVCDTPFAEADAAVAEIQRLVRGGCRYRDIAVVLRDATASVGILDAALEREGIPYFLSEKTDVTVRPLIKMLLLALRIHIHGWRAEDVIAYIKTGLCGIAADDVNLFEEYADVWQPRGAAAFSAPFVRNPDGFALRRSERGTRILEGANRAREALFGPLCALFEALENATDATQMCRALYEYLDALGIRDTLKTSAAAMLAAGERREAEELSRLYAVTVDALEAVALALGDTPLTVAGLLEALKLVFARTDIGTIPTSSDEVTVGSASMLRADHPRFVLVLGLNEGEFPRPVADDGLISEDERTRLAALDLALPSGRAEQSSNELFYVWRAFLAPREGLYLSYSKSSTDGRSLSPSIAVTRTRALLPTLPLQCFEAMDPLSQVFSPAALLDRFGDFAPDTREELAALLCELQIPAAATLERPVVDQEATVPEKTADTLFRDARFSPTHLESFASCRFAYYCDKILRLREEKDGSLGLSDTGTFLHYVLEQVLLRVKREGRAFGAWEEAEICALTRELCRAYRDELVRVGGTLTPRADALMNRLSTLAELIVLDLFAEFSDSDFRPVLTEFDLRNTGAVPTLTLRDGKRIPLSGKADRMDIWRSQGGDAFLRVVDYKTGSRQFSPADIKKGYSLQMPLYLMALTARAYPALNRELGLEEDTVLRPAGVTYFSSAVKSETTPAKKEEREALRDAMGRLDRSGVLLDLPDVKYAASHAANPAIVGSPRSKRTLDAQGFDTLFSDLEDTICRLTDEMKGGVATARPNKQSNRIACEYCRFAAICRVSQKERKGGS